MASEPRATAVGIGVVQVLLATVISGCGQQASESSLFDAADDYCCNDKDSPHPQLGESRHWGHHFEDWSLAWVKSCYEVLHDAPHDISKTVSVVYPDEGQVEAAEIACEWHPTSQTWLEAHRGTVVLTFRFHEGASWEFCSTVEPLRH
ncbi:MAG: hypothetical protein ABFE07_20225 [Armatimonadia bacterium]